MTLQAKLDEIKAGFQAQADPESLSIMGKAARDLAESNILKKVLKPGDRIPEFSLPAAQGGEIKSWEILSQGPLVISFYRGVW